jgi:hypothetical protein
VNDASLREDDTDALRTHVEVGEATAVGETAADLDNVRSVDGDNVVLALPGAVMLFVASRVALANETLWESDGVQDTEVVTDPDATSDRDGENVGLGVGGGVMVSVTVTVTAAVADIVAVKDGDTDSVAE